MLTSKLRCVVLTCALAIAMLAVPARSDACGLFSALFGSRYDTVQTACYPSCGPTACTSCYTPQTCNYVPQTCYRTVVRRVPVTTCRVTTRTSWLTGCPVTTYRPVTVWVQQASLVPYTTYRMVYSNPCGPAAGCDPCSTYGSCVGGGCGVGTYSAGPVSDGSSCGSCAPSAPPISGATTYSGSVSAATDYSSAAPLTTESQPQTVQEDAQPQTFKEGVGTQSRGALKPIPLPETKLNSTPVPNLIDPHSRTTLLPIRRASHFSLNNTSMPVSASRNDGWRAASD